MNYRMSTSTIIFGQWKHFINTRRICFVNRWFLMGSYLFSWASPVSNGLSEGSIKKKKIPTRTWRRTTPLSSISSSYGFFSITWIYGGLWLCGWWITLSSQGDSREDHDWFDCKVKNWSCFGVASWVRMSSSSSHKERKVIQLPRWNRLIWCKKTRYQTLFWNQAKIYMICSLLCLRTVAHSFYAMIQDSRNDHRLGVFIASKGDQVYILDVDMREELIQ